MRRSIALLMLLVLGWLQYSPTQTGQVGGPAFNVDIARPACAGDEGSCSQRQPSLLTTPTSTYITPTPSLTESATPTAQDPRISNLLAPRSNVAAGKKVIARSGGITYPSWGNANDVVDYATTTRPGGGRWGTETNAGGGTFQIVDLGSVYLLEGVGYSLDWDGAFVNSLTFRVEVSTDMETWKVVSEIEHPYYVQPGAPLPQLDIDVVIVPVEARYVKYWEPPDGDWNGWGDFFRLRAYALMEGPVATVSLTTTLFYQFPDTATFAATRESSPTLTPEPEQPTRTPLPKLTVGGKARVHVIRDDTLNVRSGTGLQLAILEKLADGTVVTLLEGPVEAEGYTWWRVRTPRRTEGWVVESADNVQTLIPIP